MRHGHWVTGRQRACLLYFAKQGSRSNRQCFGGGYCDNRIYNFTNKEAYSFADVAQALSEISGKHVVYTPIDIETYKNKAREKGMPEHAVEAIAPFMTDIKNGQGSTVSSDLEDALGRKPTGLKEGLKLLLGL